MHIEIKGNVGQVIVVEAGASPTIHIGGGRASVYGGNGGGVSNRCPIKEITASQRTKWAKRCIGATAPEGWTVESFSSPKAFTSAVVPEGVTKGDPIFFWKHDCSKDSAPEGFELVYLTEEGGIGIIVPVDATTSVTSSPDADEEFPFSITNSMSEEDDDDDGPPLPPPPPPLQETTTLVFEEE